MSWSELSVALDDVVDPDWGNKVRDRVVNTFANSSTRASDVTTNKEGMVTYLLDSNTLWVDKDGAGTYRQSRSAPDQYLCRLSQSSGQSIGAGSFAAINFDTEVDPPGWHSTSSNTNRITVNIGGTLLAGYQITTGTTAGYVTAYMRKNGAGAYGGAQSPGPVGADWALTGWDLIDVSAGDYIELYFGQGSAGSVTTDITRPRLMATMWSWS